MDAVTYFCMRWYHQGQSKCLVGSLWLLTSLAVVKNDVLYMYGGIETFNAPNVSITKQNNTLGYSKYAAFLVFEIASHILMTMPS
jgi:hypothetical protein